MEVILFTLSAAFSAAKVSLSDAPDILKERLNANANIYFLILCFIALFLYFLKLKNVFCSFSNLSRNLEHVF